MTHDNSATPRDDDTLDALAGWEGAAILVWVIVVELSLLQAIGVGAATAIYHLAPLLEVGQPQDFDDWLDIFQIVGPMLTLPGGATIVLSTWLLTRRAQRAERRAERRAAARIAAEKERADTAEANSEAANKRADAAEANSEAANKRADTAEAALAAAQAEVERLRAQNRQ